MDTQHRAAVSTADVDPIGPFYTTSEVARLLHMSQRMVQVWVRSGQLRAAHYGAAWRISHTDLQAFVDAASARPEATDTADVHSAPVGAAQA
jgi:excisionase family DNA binding protein